MENLRKDGWKISWVMSFRGDEAFWIVDAENSDGSITCMAQELDGAIADVFRALERLGGSIPDRWRIS